MISEKQVTTPKLKVSAMAETLIGSEIIKIAGDVNEKIRQGEKIFNFTIGDFDPKIFPIPQELEEEIIKAYEDQQTNYPAANGMVELRKAVSEFIFDQQKLTYSAEEILISGGARPLIYGVYKTLLDAGDSVIFPVPSWNNNHYCHLMYADPILIEASPENNFMPVAQDMIPHLSKASMVALCSPLNPTGTMFSKQALEEICDLIIAENLRRGTDQKPLYLMYDQIYCSLVFGKNKHYDPVTLRPELRDYTIYIDGISKSLAATGVRVGWAFGPLRIMEKMRSILSHIGAWAPKAEQIATARYLGNKEAVQSFLESFKESIEERLVKFHEGFVGLKARGFRVTSIAPQAAIYLTVQLNLLGMSTEDDKALIDSRDITAYMLDEAGLALVPFYAFGSSIESTWFRLSVGACRLKDIPEALTSLEKALSKLK